MAQMKKAAAKKPAAKKGSALNEVAKRFGITAREARDIATAVGTVAKLKFDKEAQYGRYTYPQAERRKAVKDLKKQVSETVTAAKTGKKGTTSGRAVMSDGEYPYTYGAGTKRK